MSNINNFLGKSKEDEGPVEPTQEELEACVKMEKERDGRKETSSV